MRCAPTPPQCPWPSMMCQKFPDVFAPSAASFCYQHFRKVGRKTSPEASWWLREAICFALEAPGGLLVAPRGPRWGSKSAKKEVLRFQGATESLQMHQKSPKEAPKSIQNRPKKAPKHHQEHLSIPNLDFSKIELPQL